MGKIVWIKHPLVTAFLGLIVGMVIIGVASDCPEPIPESTQRAFNTLVGDFNEYYQELLDEYEALQNELNQVRTAQTQQFTELKVQYDQLRKDYSNLLASNAELRTVYNPDLVSQYSALRAKLTTLQGLYYELGQENERLKKELKDVE